MDPEADGGQHSRLPERSLTVGAGHRRQPRTANRFAERVPFHAKHAALIINHNHPAICKQRPLTFTA